MKARIRHRRIAFTMWAVSLLAVSFAAFTYWFPFGQSVQYRQMWFVNGVLIFSTFPFPPETQEGWISMAGEIIWPESWSELSEELFAFEIDRNFARLSFSSPSLLMLLVTSILLWRPIPKRKGCCTNCGYDLTGNVSGICSECGSARQSN